MRLEDIAHGINVSIIPKKSMELVGITYPEVANEAQIAIVFSKNDVYRTNARVVLSNKILLGTGKVVIPCRGPVLASAKKIAEMFVRTGEYQDYGLQEKYSMQSDCVMLGTNVLVGKASRIGAFSTVGSGVQIGSDCWIGEHVYIGAGTVIGDNVIVKPGARIASPAFFMYDRHPANDFVGFGKVIIGDGVSIGTNTVIQRGTFSDTVIGSNTGIGDGVVIGHDVRIGRACRIVSQSGIAGRSVLANNVELLGQVGVAEKIHIGEGAIIKAKSLVSKNVNSYEIISGLYGRRHRDEMRLQANLRKKF